MSTRLAGEYRGKRTLTSVAKRIETEKKSERIDKQFLYKVYVRDNDHSMSFFIKVCKHVGNLPDEEIERMLAILKEDVPHAEYEVWHFDEEKMYRVLISNPICQKVCEKQKYMNWQDLIRRFR